MRQQISERDSGEHRWHEARQHVLRTCRGLERQLCRQNPRTASQWSLCTKKRHPKGCLFECISGRANYSADLTKRTSLADLSASGPDLMSIDLPRCSGGATCDRSRSRQRILSELAALDTLEDELHSLCGTAR